MVPNDTPTVMLRGKAWYIHTHLYPHKSNLSTAEGECLVYPAELTADEVQVVEAAWSLYREKRKEIEARYSAFYKAQRRREWENLAEGDVWIRRAVWIVEEDYIWKPDAGGPKS